jgi:hypothetical protein
MTHTPPDHEATAPAGEELSPLDMKLLPGSLALTVAAGFAPEHSKLQYGLLGLAGLAYAKVAAGILLNGDPAPDHEQDPRVLEQHNDFGEL